MDFCTQKGVLETGNIETVWNGYGMVETSVDVDVEHKGTDAANL